MADTTDLKAAFLKGQAQQARLHELIPGGGHTYSKGQDQFPEISPGLISRAEGAYCWDVDGNRFLDYGMGLRSVGLGHANPEVNEAVKQQLALGTNFTRPGIKELELAELVSEIVPSIEMVKFAKNGSDVTSAAVRLARAFTGKKYVAICKEHPFYSFNDWFIAATPCDNGIPKDISNLTLKFSYNDLTSLENLFAEYGDNIAGIILEPAKIESPCESTLPLSQPSNCANCECIQPNFLQAAKEIAHRHGAIMILDEMISGFRWALSGAQSLYNVEPDLTTFGKATANGYSVSILGGRREIMELGGIQHSDPRVFLLSGTHGAENTGLAAAIKNIEVYRRDDVVGHHWSYGKKFMEEINSISSELGICDQFEIGGFACSPVVVAKNSVGDVDPGFLTLFSQELIQKGVLMPWIAFSASHGDAELEYTLDACSHALRVYRDALNDGLEKYLVGSAVKPVWRRFN